MITVGEIVRNARLEANISIRKLSRLSNISDTAIRAIEADKRKYSQYYTIKELANHIPINLEEYKELLLADLNAEREDTIGLKIKKARLSKGITLEELSIKSGISLKQLHNIETNKTKKPRYKTLIKLSKIIPLTPEEYVREIYKK